MMAALVSRRAIASPLVASPNESTSSSERSTAVTPEEASRVVYPARDPRMWTSACAMP